MERKSHWEGFNASTQKVRRFPRREVAGTIRTDAASYETINRPKSLHYSTTYQHHSGQKHMDRLSTNKNTKRFLHSRPDWQGWGAQHQNRNRATKTYQA